MLSPVVTDQTSLVCVMMKHDATAAARPLPPHTGTQPNLAATNAAARDRIAHYWSRWGREEDL